MQPFGFEGMTVWALLPAEEQLSKEDCLKSMR